MSTLGFQHIKGKDQKYKMAILKHALQNAVLHAGKANAGAVMGKVMAEMPELRNRVGFVKSEIEKTAQSVNFISFEEQKRRLEMLDPETTKPKKKEEQGLPELSNAEMGKVVTRFAPSPSGPLNILQVLRALMLSYLYARMYKGKFILRFEDTDPTPGKIEKQFYEMIREDIRFLEIKWDEEITESNNMEMFYEYAENLIENGFAYVDFTPADKFKELKIKEKDPDNRSVSPKENLKAWKAMIKGDYKEGQAVLRFKTSMQDKNPAFRDPAIFRIARSNHPIVGDKYCVWPLYNFANVIEDHEARITHVFRGKEHEHNSFIQERIYRALGWEPPHVLNFGMIYLPGEKEHTRDIKEKIKKSVYSGWDDPRLHTISALRNRGFQGKAFHKVAVVVGSSKSDIRFSMESLETANRRIIDPQANRYMAVFEPMKISVKGYPHSVNFVTEPFHPDFPERGNKSLPVEINNILISGDDWKRLKGKTFRLKGLANIKLSGKTGKYAGDDLDKDMKKIQWVSRPGVDIEMIVPDGNQLHVRKGVGEPAMSKLKKGELIQLERVGFGIIDAVKKDKIRILWAHK